MDRYATAALLLPAGPTATVRLADGRDLPTALSAAGWAAAIGQGLLLADDSGGLDTAREALRRMVAELVADGTVGGVRDADPTRVGKLPAAGELILATRSGAVDAVAAAATGVVSGAPTFVPAQPLATGGHDEVAAVLETLAPQRVWLVGRAGNLDARDLLCHDPPRG